ncbi:hypothetical protein [Spiroplasma ixodetis]|uniref:Lipoprotein n=1 Tax=Spiroplasma ixodetis TaxID=2141 RepID=A0ABN7BXB9_9MOLU
MRSMKTLLRLLGAVSLTTVAASSVVACGTEPEPKINVDVAKLLNWYDAQGNTLIKQIIGYNNSKVLSIIADNSKINTANLFKDKLLIQGSAADKFKAKNSEATKLLSEFGFKTGSDSKDYSDADVASITKLIAKVTNNNPGKIEESGTTDFKVSDGISQVNIMDKDEDNAKILKSYTIKTLKNDTLSLPILMSNVVNTTTLDLSKEKGYVQGGNVLTSLPWKKDDMKKSYGDYVNCFKSFKEELIWTSDSFGQKPITTYPTTGNAYLTIKFGNVKVINVLACGEPYA